VASWRDTVQRARRLWTGAPVRPLSPARRPAIDLNPLPFGNYFLLERLAVGGMAEVYLAKAFGVAGFERLVALKRILPTIAEDDEFIAMFIDEAKIAGQLSHANVAQIFDLGKINNSYFIAMEYISGHDLRALWDRVREDGALPLELGCYVVKKMCEGLDYAHRRRDNRGRPLGIIHRDVSPQNILLSYDGDIKVIDFGIAKAANRMVRTQTGILKGKFAYMAPEQARGEPTDHRADIFAIGVILYELITGERAFKADSDFALLEKVRRVDITPPRKLRSEVPKDLEKIIYRAMAREAKDRYAWASGLASDLDRFMSDHDLRYNKDELGAYVRARFSSEHKEENRRLKAYQGYRPDHLDEEELPEPPDTAVGADNPTVVRSDPSLEPYGTEDGDTQRGPSITEEGESEEEVSEEGSGFEEGYTLPIDELPKKVRKQLKIDDDDDDGPDTSHEIRRPRARALDSEVPWEDPSAARRRGAKRRGGNGLPASTQIDVAQPGYRATPDDEEDSEEGGDETMVDSGPVDDDDPAASLPLLGGDRRREGVRPQMRGASLGEVLGTGTSTEARRARTTGPTEAPSEISPPNGARARPGARVETERFDDRRLRPERRPEPGRLALVAGLTGLVGAILGVLMGVLFFAGSDGSDETFIVVRPRATSVSLGDRTLCDVTPCVAQLPAGSHELVFETEGRRPTTKTVTVGAGQRVVDIELLGTIEGLRVNTNPPGARVWLDGKALPGKTPLSLPKLSVGQQIKLKLLGPGPAWDPIEDIVEVDGKGVPLEFELPAKQTEWAISVEPEDGVLFVEGKKARAKRAREEIARGESRIVIARRPGCEEKSLVLQGNGKKKDEAVFKLSCRVFDARISVFGLARTDVEIDGIDLAHRTPLREYPVPSGEHLVLARRRGKQAPYLVQVVPGQTVTVNTKVK
jgi:serine/threonine protein kinase